MPTKELLFKSEAEKKISLGVEKVASAVASTMGPKGHAVMYEGIDSKPVFTQDGVTVAREISLEDPFEKLGADAIKEASAKTNDVAGDGTTTAAVLARAIYNEGKKRISNGENPTDVRAKIEKETKEAVEKLRAMAVPADTIEALEQVATISSKDAELGKTIAGLINQVGTDGLVTIEISPSFGVETEITSGMKLDTGFVANWMVTNPDRMNTRLDECPVVVTDTTVGLELGTLMSALAQKGHKRMFIVADGFNPEALALMYTNGAQGKFVSVGIRASGIGEKRKMEELLDLCAVTGATLISETTGKTIKDAKVEHCGFARQITVSSKDTVIVEGAGKQEEKDKRISVIRAELAETKSDYDKVKLKERLARLTGSAGVIKVGGTNEAEIKERKDRVEDAVNAVRAAQSEGIVVGGGTALLNASVGLEAILEPLRAPLRTIVGNAGKSADVILDKCLTLPMGEGYNAATDTYGDLISMGVIDPLKVTRTALENASAVAGLLLITECAIVNKREAK